MPQPDATQLQLKLDEFDCNVPGGLVVELSHIIKGYCTVIKSSHTIAPGSEATLQWISNGRREYQCGYLPEGLDAGEFIQCRFLPYLGG